MTPVLAPTLPPPFPTNYKSLRFYQAGTATSNFADKAWAFQRVDPANPAIPEQAWSGSIIIRAETADLEFSFDGTNVHGKCPAGKESRYDRRFEGGIYVRGSGSVFSVEAW